MAKGQKKEKPETEKAGKVTFGIDKDANFSEWFTEIIKRAELADIRYNVKGFVVFQPWSVLCMEEMYKCMERALQRTGHNPCFFPALIPEKNLTKEREHVEGFAPEVFWVTEHGAGKKLDEKLALRPTSETAFYQMFSLWIRSYNDLPFRTYQRAQVWRHETKATRPFIRGREFHWIEAHDAFETMAAAEKQVQTDMQITEDVMHQLFGIPFIFFRRPAWDKFPGAVDTFGADSIMPDGKLIQQPSTHILGQNFSKPFNVKFVDRDSKEKYAYLTCFGPCISRMFASVVAMHGDSKGLRFPFEIAPMQVVIVPVASNKSAAVLKRANALLGTLLDAGYRACVDAGQDKGMGGKFYFWEMKGVPLRVEIGPKEVKEKRLTVYRRDNGKKQAIPEKRLLSHIQKTAPEITKNLRAQADRYFKNLVVDAKTVTDVKGAVENKKIARVNFCSTGNDGAQCAEIVEKQLLARVRGTRVDKKEKPAGECVFCGKQAKEVVYIGREY